MADKILKFVMYNKKLKNKMLVFLVYDFFFQMSLIGLILVVLMVLLKEMTLQNCMYTAVCSGIGGVMSAYFDMGKVKKGTLTVGPKSPSDTQDFLITIAVIAGYLIGIAATVFFLMNR